MSYNKSLCLALALLLPASVSWGDTDTTRTAVVEKKNMHNALFFLGKLLPVHTIAINSPINGHIQSMNFSYGQIVHKGDLLITLESSEFSKNFQSAFQKYLTAKDKYNNDKETFVGTKMLFKAGVTQRNTYLSSLSSFNTDVISFYQAKLSLEEMLQKAHMKKDRVESIKLGNIKEVKKMLDYHLEGYGIKSSLTGIALFPGQSGGDKSSQKLSVGKAIKEGETILTIGSLSGYSATISVSEVSINKIKKGMPVKITGDGFPGTTLHGHVSHVSSQATPKQGGPGSASMFQVIVTIDALPPAKSTDRIRIGMSCKVSINTSQKDQLVVPMGAISEENNQTIITLISGGKQTSVAVRIGNTTPDGHIIIHGKVKAGDQVLLHDD